MECFCTCMCVYTTVCVCVHLCLSLSRSHHRGRSAVHLLLQLHHLLHVLGLGVDENTVRQTHVTVAEVPPRTCESFILSYKI